MEFMMNVIEYDMSTLTQWSDEKLYMCLGYLKGEVMKNDELGQYRLSKVFHSLYGVIEDEMKYRGLKVPVIEE